MITHSIISTEWNEPLYPGTSIEQFGLDLLCRILAADVKHLYDVVIEDVHANRYGVIPKNENPMDLIILKHTHPVTMIVPDRSHTIELVKNVQDKTNDLAYYIDKLSDLTDTIQQNTKWTKKVYIRKMGSDFIDLGRLIVTYVTYFVFIHLYQTNVK
jgi:hypothetical protein